MNDIKIISYNCRGLHDAKKRADVFQFLKERDASIYCLQDVHFTSNMEKHLYSQWNSNCYFSYSRSNARGVAILFSRNIDVKVHQTHVDENGNYIILDLTFNSKRFSLINIYGPNIDQPEFYQNIIRIIDMVGKLEINLILFFGSLWVKHREFFGGKICHKSIYFIAFITLFVILDFPF